MSDTSVAPATTDTLTEITPVAAPITLTQAQHCANIASPQLRIPGTIDQMWSLCNKKHPLSLYTRDEDDNSVLEPRSDVSDLKMYITEVRIDDRSTEQGPFFKLSVVGHPVRTTDGLTCTPDPTRLIMATVGLTSVAGQFLTACLLGLPDFSDPVVIEPDTHKIGSTGDVYYGTVFMRNISTGASVWAKGTHAQIKEIKAKYAPDDTCVGMERAALAQRRDREALIPFMRECLSTLPVFKAADSDDINF